MYFAPPVAWENNSERTKEFWHMMAEHVTARTVARKALQIWGSALDFFGLIEDYAGWDIYNHFLNPQLPYNGHIPSLRAFREYCWELTTHSYLR